MNWYHGTSKENEEKILRTWFYTSMGRWGNGVYFSASRDSASLFGGAILKVDIPAEEILNINFTDWEIEYPIEEEWPELLNRLNSAAVAIHYESGEVELCVFNPKIIRQIFL